MKANETGVSREKEKAEAHQRAWDAQYADKDVEICEKIEEEKDMNLHCYVCKMWGHTKVNPNPNPNPNPIPNPNPSPNPTPTLSLIPIPTLTLTRRSCSQAARSMRAGQR